MSYEKIRSALARLRDEARMVERDQHKYAELAYSPSASTLEYIADDIEAGLAEAEKPCTCHPDDNPPRPCPKRYALSECCAAQAAQPKPEPVGEVRDMKYNTAIFYYDDRYKRSGYLQPGTKLYTAPPPPTDDARDAARVPDMKAIIQRYRDSGDWDNDLLNALEHDWEVQALCKTACRRTEGATMNLPPQQCLLRQRKDCLVCGPYAGWIGPPPTWNDFMAMQKRHDEKRNAEFDALRLKP